MIGLRRRRAANHAQRINFGDHANVVAPAGAAVAAEDATAPVVAAAEPVIAPRADATQLRASTPTNVADPWLSFVDHFNELAASAPAGGTTTRPLRRQADASPESGMPSASAFALQAARELREARARERTLEVAEADEQLRRRTERRAQAAAVDRFPLSGLPVDDGCKYVGADFQPQLDLAERDEFLEVMGMPPLFDEPRARFAMAEASARHRCGFAATKPQHRRGCAAAKPRHCHGFAAALPRHRCGIRIRDVGDVWLLG